MDESHNFKNVFVDINALLDTVLPIIQVINPACVEELFITEKYINRVKDDFPGLPYGVIKALKRHIGKGVLVPAETTSIIRIIKEHLEGLTVEDYSNGEQMLVFINSFPYELDDDEKNILINTFEKLLPTARVEIVYMCNSDISPEFLLNKKISMFVKYNGMEWIDAVFTSGELMKKPLLNKVTLVLPMLSSSIMVPSRDINKNMFERVKMQLSNLLDILFLPTYFFSAVTMIPEKNTLDTQ